MRPRYLAPDGATFFDLVDTYLNPDERRAVRAAFELARQEHGDERRKSGELFFTHPLTIAYYLAEYQMDASALVAALLHDVVEDTRVSVEEIEEQFGPEIGRLVGGLTKFEAVTGGATTLSKEELQNATLHRLFGVMTDDVRVGIIKLFDRLHNMLTIKATPPATQRRKAEETLAVYAPLANRLGMWEMKNELEALSLEVLDSEAYQVISQRLEQMRHQHQSSFAPISHQIAEHLTKAGLEIVDITLSPESIYSVYRTARMNGQSRYKVSDTLRLVVVLKDVASCYLALGQLHHLWRPVPGTFDDYIAAPRDNLYRSLHTTLIYGGGQRIKVRLRTLAMHVLAEIGVLARWVHIGVPLWSQEIAQRVDMMVDNISESINVEPHDPRVSVQGIVQDVFRDQIMVYTPAGDVKELPKGATPLDFAYTIHTEVGAQCRAALVNDQPAALNQPLKDGDRVQIIKRGRAPQRIWLDEDLGYLMTNRARTKVRHWFRRLAPARSIAEGRQLLEDELAMLGLLHYSHAEIASWLGYEETEALYDDLGRAELLPTALSTRVLEKTWHQGARRNVASTVYTEEGEKLLVANAGGRPLRLCRTCHPRPDDAIVGFARNDGSVTIHSERCSVLPLDPFSARTLKLGWATEASSEVRLFTIQIDVYDRTGLLYEISRLIHSEKLNMPAVHAESEAGQAILVMDIEVATPRQLVRLLHRTLALVNVYAVTCLPPESSVASNGAGSASWI